MLCCVSIRLDNLQSITVFRVFFPSRATPSRRFVLGLAKSRLFIDANESMCVCVLLHFNSECIERDASLYEVK